MIGERERIAHVVRRASMGVHPDVVSGLDSVDAAKARVLDLSAPVRRVPLGTPPATFDEMGVGEVFSTIAWWIEQMRAPSRLIEERLVWFWHDHFATSIAKCTVPYLMAQQHATVRAHATGSFAELLRAVAKDPATLMYLDGITNAAGSVNENFGRECMELFTMGIRGGYTQGDVVEISRACTGWLVNIPGRGFSGRLDALGAAPWSAICLPKRHDTGVKTLFGTSADFDLDSALDAVLAQEATGPFIAGKLYREFVGLDADDATARRLGHIFSRQWSIMHLVKAILDEPAFTSDAALRVRVRSPIEKLVGILQAGNAAALDGRVPISGSVLAIAEALRALGYIPFFPPNVAGFPRGASLFGLHQFVNTLGLLAAYPQPPEVPDDLTKLFARFGIYDITDATNRRVAAEREPVRRFALVATSPEFTVV